MECTSWPSETMDQKKIYQELVEGRDLTIQLQTLVQIHAIVAADKCVEKILESFGRAISMVSSENLTGGGDIMCESPVSVTTTTTTTQPSSPFSQGNSDEKRKIPAMKDRRGGYKRRKSSNTWTKLTEKPIEDGYAWRKYGQKEILNATHPRNYFRCTHKNDQGCQATKQVQKTEDEPSMYQTTYMGHHTCTDPLKPLQIILDPSPSSSPQNMIFNFKSNPTTTNSKQDLRPLFASFPSFKLEPKDEQEDPITLQYQCSLHDQYFSNDLSPFETSQPTSMLASCSSGSDHGDVISSVYSCTTSPNSLDLDLVVDNVDFNDDVFLDEFF